MSAQLELILVLARLTEYTLRGERDAKLQDFRRELNRAIGNAEKENVKPNEPAHLHQDCPRAGSATTPCVRRDGHAAVYTVLGKPGSYCVGCEMNQDDILLELETILAEKGIPHG